MDCPALPHTSMDDCPALPQTSPEGGIH